MGFQQGLSGLNAASKSLEAIGNNVANSNTVGFKGSQTQFADVYAASLTGASSISAGIGVQVAAIAQQFTQGNITASNNPMDIAINGNGFFRLSSGGTILYSRNGQFSLDKEGYIVNNNGARLTGFVANSAGTLTTGAPVDISIDTSDLAPKMTTAVQAVMNLDSSKAAPTITPFDPLNPLTYTNATSVSVYDSLGNARVIQTYYVKSDTVTGQWDVYASVDDVPVNYTPADNTTVPPTPASQTAIGTLLFGTDGQIATATPTGGFPVPIAAANGAAAFTPTIDYTGTSQFGAAFSVNSMKQDGFTSGRLSGFAAGDDGVITGRYTNGKTRVLGQVVLASFVNANGLIPQGNNMWAESAASGPALVGGPSSGGLGVLQSGATEDSNVDMTAELVNMITAQRVYQANAQTIKTQDQVLQTMVNLR
jgi:flagellar hook protein FlgE